MSTPTTTAKVLDYSTPDTVRAELEARLRAVLARIESRLRSDSNVTGTYDRPSVFRIGSTFDGWGFLGIDWAGIGRPHRVATVGETLAHLGEIAPAMARQEADRIGLVLNLVHPAKLRPAVLERLVPVWPWWVVGGVNEEPGHGFAMLDELMKMEGAALWDLTFPQLAAREAAERIDAKQRVGQLLWPPDVATLHALRWVRDGLNRIWKGAGDAYEAKAHAVAAPPTIAQLAPISYYFGGQPADASDHLYVLGNQFAWAYSAVAGVERGQHERAFKLPANKHAHTIAAMFVRPPTDKLTDVWTGAKLTGADLVLEWNGKRTPYQLELHADAGGDVNNEIARGLVAELGPDALRDWLALHRSTSEQGSSGSFLWTWEEHRERTHYADRVRRGNVRDADLARASRQRIWRFKQAELWASARAADGKVYRYRIGPFGLVDVDREILEADGKTPAVVGGRFNPEIYGSRGKGRAAGFTLLPDAALRLPDAELRIAVSAFYAMRHGAGATRMKARTLWDYAGLTEGQRKDRRRWLQCRAVTERTLDALSAIGIRWAGGGALPDDVYELTAPGWWTDRLVHRVGPVLAGPATAGVPRTGLELAAMRKARGLSQRALAGVVGASQPTVQRAEKSPEALPAAWLPKLAEARLTMPG